MTTDTKISVREAGPYDRQNGRDSYFLDRIAAVSPIPVPGIHPGEARERLHRHAIAATARSQRNTRVAEGELSRLGIQCDDGGYQVRSDGSVVHTRALAAQVAGAGQEFAPPAWLVDEVWTPVARGASPFLTLSPPRGLPDYGMELVLSRLDFDNGVRPAAENTTAPVGLDQPTDDLVAPVLMLTGAATVSQQLVDRGHHFDETVARDAALSFGAQFQQALITGTGSDGQLLGALNVPTATVNGIPGAVAASYTSSEPSPGGLVAAIAGLAGQVADARKLMPQIILCRGSRYLWIAGTADANGEPTQRPGVGLIARDTSGPYGPIAGLPVYTADAVPVTGGQDTVIVCRPADFLLFASEPRFDVVVDTASGAGNLTVTLVWRAYCSAFVNQYPSGIGRLTGSGLTIPEGF